MSTRFRRPVAWSVALACAALLLASCTITIRPGGGYVIVQPGASSIIASFAATRSVVRVGDRVSFRIETRGPGYVTLTAIDPDGRVYEIARNVPVTGRGVEQIPAAGSRVVFLAVPPTGHHVVRAHVTPAPTPERVVFAGLVGESAWYAAIRLELTGTGFVFEDTAEAHFQIVR